MDELLAAVFAAPVANLFIIGGLVFLGLGVVGKVAGKIEPSKTGRILSAALGVLFLIVGLVMHTMPAASPAPQATPAVQSDTPTPPAPTAAPLTDTPAPAPQGNTSTPPTATPVPPAASATDGLSLPAGSWQPVADLPRQINALVADPTNPQVLYAGTGDAGSGSGVYKSEDAGLTWRLAADGLPSEDVEALAISHGDPPLLYASAGGEAFASADGAESWTSFGDIGLVGGFYHDLTVDPSEAARVFLVIRPGGIARSLDGGHTWLPLRAGLPGDDRGAHVLSLAIDATAPNVVYAGTGAWVGGGHGVYKSIDAGETWSAANRGMMDYRISALAVAPQQPQTVYAGGDDGELFKSTDGGETWTDLTDRLPPQMGSHHSIWHIALDPANPEGVYVLADGVGVLNSSDGGASWRPLGMPGEPDYPSFTAMATVFDLQLVLVVGIERAGGWRYAPSPP